MRWIACKTHGSNTNRYHPSYTPPPTPPLPPNPPTPSPKSCSITDRVNVQGQALDEFLLHVEHEFASIKEKISTLVGKLEQREESAEKRIDSLEHVVKTEVEGTLTTRLEQLEQQIRGNLDGKMNTINRQLDMKIGHLETVAKKVNDATDKMAAGDGQWKWLLAILAVFSLAIGGGWFWTYRFLVKKHFL